MLTGTIKSYNPHKGALALQRVEMVSWVSGFCFRMVVLERRQLHGCIAFPAQFFFGEFWGWQIARVIAHKAKQNSPRLRWFFETEVILSQNTSLLWGIFLSHTFPGYVFKNLRPSNHKKCFTTEAVFSSISSHSSSPPRLGVYWVQRAGYLCE